MNLNIITIIIAGLGAGTLSLLPVTIDSAFSFAFGSVITGLILQQLVKLPNSRKDLSDDVSKQEGTTLYVGNLPYRANEPDVKELFSQFGHVHAVRLMKDKRTGKRRGFGFVVVAEQDVDKVIKNLNNTEFDQRTLKVRIANDPKSSDMGKSSKD